MVTSKLKDCPTRPECPNCGMAMVTIERTEHKDNVENCKFECCAAVTSRSASQRKLAGAGPADQAASCAVERLVQRWISSHRKLGLWAYPHWKRPSLARGDQARRRSLRSMSRQRGLGS
jgi:hypothetical protein